MKKPLSKEVTEDFWNDCYDNPNSKLINELLQKKNYSNYYGRNNNIKKKFNNNQNYSINILSHHNKNNRKKGNNSSSKINNKTIDNPNLSKIYENHQILKDNIEIQKVDKDLELKRKNAMMRCLGLYAYGVEVKNAKLLNDENNKKERVKDEMSQCTFRPKISKYSHSIQSKYNPELNYKNKNNNNIINSNGDYKMDNTNTNTIENGVTKKNVKNLKNNNIKNNINNDYEDSEDLEECTFKPKINKINIKKVFGKSKSLANEKDNAEFILRYTKAREEYMIKKLKKISTKDYSYDMTLFSLANRLNNKNNKHGINDAYDEKLPKNNKKRNMSMNDYKDYSVENKKKINIEQNIIKSLRNDLLDIDLNEEE